TKLFSSGWPEEKKLEPTTSTSPLPSYAFIPGWRTSTTSWRPHLQQNLEFRWNSLPQRSNFLGTVSTSTTPLVTTVGQLAPIVERSLQNKENASRQARGR